MRHWDFPRSSASVQILLELAAAHGLDPARCLEGTRLTPALLADPALTLEAGDELQVARHVQQLLGENSCPGLQAGLRYHLSSYGIWGFALLSSQTLRSAIELGLGTIELTFAFCRISAEPDGRDLRLIIDADDLPADMQRFMIERELAAIQTIQRELFASPLPMAQIELTFAEDQRRACYAEVLGEQLRFGGRRNTTVIPGSLLDLPLPQANPVTASFCMKQCRLLLQQRRARTGVAGQVRDQLLREPGRIPAMQEVAVSLHHSLRSLHRHLAAEGTSFRTLVDEVRVTLAEELLGTHHLSVMQVAERLGYAEPASFLHAFRRWKGMTPSQWQTQAHADAGTKFRHLR